MIIPEEGTPVGFMVSLQNMLVEGFVVVQLQCSSLGRSTDLNTQYVCSKPFQMGQSHVKTFQMSQNHVK